MSSPIVGDDEIHAQLISSVDEAIKDLLGVGVVDAFYSHLATNGIPRTEIPSKLDRFCWILEETFGVAGLTIQRGIAMRFYQKLGLSFKSIEKGKLMEYVKEAKGRMKTR
ncbi:MAG TPA: hypothetical protein VE862_03625 [Candidatus Acidoferrum sp.]|nr:hypothetical protein [Candidatus Acidoferrum sp.]